MFGSDLRGRWLNWAITAASCQGFLLLGYDQGVMSGIIGAENQFGNDFNNPDANMQGLIVSIYDIGCAFGSLISFFFAETYGRKNMIIAGGTTMIIGTIILTSSTTIAQLLVGHDTAIDDAEVVETVRTIQVSIEKETRGGPFQYKELISGGPMGNFRRICLCLAVNVMQQFTGSNMINYYAPTVYEQNMGLSRTISLILGGCTSLTYLVGSFIPLWTVDRYGRRALLMFSAAGLCVCFSLASILLSTGTQPAAYGATAMVFLFQIFLGIGWLPIPWFYPSEVTTTRIRSKGQALGSFINWTVQRRTGREEAGVEGGFGKDPEAKTLEEEDGEVREETKA
ncbi:Sugar transporter STL1 [Lasiodiplodia theobromae]|uniref:Sugar transporter STL1 n=1 Tax=Lasiodiplodia theobromae TaxID=45133 RepID=A0A5N5DN67_9PEZI|nr:Sugar transporter STL1 [Lasiodiplodia theobromae]